jgi:transcriptional regulator with PAS, ATPase and Fis domain
VTPLALEASRALREQLQGPPGFEPIIGRSPAMVNVFELVRKAARSEVNILVVGESGTGKELVARAVHANSPRAAQPFVAVDWASLPEQLLESELFGHEQGAFTGAVRMKRGLMEAAHGGTPRSTGSRYSNRSTSASSFTGMTATSLPPPGPPGSTGRPFTG